LYAVNTQTKAVALTIDDAPHAHVTPQILDILRENAAHATFFVLGDNIEDNEAILERMKKEGHEIGNHLERDYPSILLSPDEFKNQLCKVDEVIQPAGQIKWFRPGSGWYNNRMLRQVQEHNYRCALASIYPHDTLTRSVWLISTYILTKLFPGGIIVLHDGKADRMRTAKVLKRILPILKSKGYRVVTLSELVSEPLAP